MEFFNILRSIDNEFYKYDLDLQSYNKTIKNDLEANVKPLFSMLDKEIKKIREKQPQFKKTLHLQKREIFPQYFIFGRLKIFHQLLEEKYIPRLLKFPLLSALYSRDKKDIYFIYQYILRVLQISPLNKIDFVLIDTLSVGKVFNFLRPVLNNDFIYSKKILTTSKEINEALKEIYEYMEYILQKQLSGYKNFRDYNLKNPKSQLPLKVLIVYGFPTLFDSNSFFYFEKIIEYGSIAGINTLFIVDSFDENNKNLYKLVQNIFKNSILIKEYNPEFDFLRSLKIKTDFDTFPTPYNMKGFLEEINESYKKKSTIKGKIDAFWNENFWEKKSIDGISIPIGWDKKEDIVNFEFGFDYSEHHTLIGGRSGSGKSNLINVIIQNIAYLYSPDEVELYLLDYKDGVEFNLYKDLNHASLVAINSNVSYGITVLEHILDIKNKRSELFKKVGAKDFKQYREMGYELSRIVIIIDEFQTLFTTREKNKAEKIFAEILRKGRSFGIHLILSTQTLSGIEINSITQLKSQIGNRIALSMGENESRNFLSNANDLASKIKKPQGIYNNAAGSVEGNNIVYIPLANYENYQKLKTYLKDKKRHKTIIYNGEMSIPLPKEFNNKPFEIILGKEDNFLQNDLKIIFSRFSGSNLLISGKDRKIKEKILNIIIQNLANQTIYYINSDEEIEIDILKSDIKIFENDLKNCFIIIDSLDTLNELHSQTYPPIRNSNNEILVKFKDLLENGYKKNIHFIVFIDNLKKMRQKINDYLNNFEFRVGFSLNQEVATMLLSQSNSEIINTISKNRAIFSDFYNFEIKHFKIFGV